MVRRDSFVAIDGISDIKIVFSNKLRDVPSYFERLDKTVGGKEFYRVLTNRGCDFVTSATVTAAAGLLPLHHSSLHVFLFCLLCDVDKIMFTFFYQ